MKKSFIYILIIFSLISQNIFAGTLFQNDIKAINFTKNSIGKPEINITLDKNDVINVIRKDDLEYVILLPETSSSIKSSPKLDKVSDIINSIDIKTQPYTSKIKGYTKITIKTSKPININTKTIVYNSKKQDPVTKPTAKPIVKQETKLAVKPETPKPIVKQETPKSTITEEIKLEPDYKHTISASKNISKPVVKQEETKPVIKQEIPKPVVKQETKLAVKPETPKPIVKQEVKPKEVKHVENTEPKVTVSEQTKDIKPAEPTVVKEEQSKKIIKEQKESENIATKDTAIKDKKRESYFTSILITCLLLLLLFILKRYNRKHANKQQNKTSNTYSISGLSKDFVPSTEIIMPVHENFEHKQNKNLDNEILEKTQDLSSNEYLKREANISFEEHVEPQNSIEEQSEQNIVPINSVEEQTEQDIELLNSIEEQSEQNNIESINNFEKQTEQDIELLNNIEEQSEQNNIEPQNNIEEQSEQNNIEPQNSIEKQTEQDIVPINSVEEQTEQNIAPINSVEEQSKLDIELQNIYKEQDVNNTIEIEDSFNTQFNEDVSPDDVFGVFEDEQKDEIGINEYTELNTEENITNVEINTEENSEITENIADETTESETKETQEDDNVIQDSYNFTPTKSIYLINYEGSSILMASIKDEYFVLKKFDELINKPLIVRQTEKNTKKTTYIVRIGSFRGVIEVTLKNLEMVLEL